MRRAPSLKVLCEAFNISEEHATHTRAIFKASRACLLATSRAAARLEKVSHGSQHTETLRLHALSEALQMHGIECVAFVNGEHADYLNAGDPYAPTVIYWRGVYRVQDLDTFLTRARRAYY